MPLTSAAHGLARRTALTLAIALLVALATAAGAQAVPTITVSPSPVVGQPVTLTAGDDAGPLAGAPAWTVTGPDGAALPPLPAEPVVSFTPAAAGTYAVALTVPPSAPVLADVVVQPPPDTPPTITVAPSVVRVQAGGTASFTASATDPDGPVTIGWRVGASGPADPFDDASGTTLSQAFSSSTTVEAQVTGTPGVTATASAQVQVVLPTAGFTVDGSDGPVLQGREVTLASTSTDPGSAPPLDPAPGPLEFDWDLPGDAPDDGFEDGPTLVHAFTAPGTVPVTLRVRDLDDEIAILTRDVEVDPGTAPVAGFGVTPAALLPGLPATFTSTATDVDGNIAGLEWDFGDGGGFAPGGPVVTHAYAAPGSYPVRHRVTDEAGLAHVAFDTVTVAAPPAVAPPAPPVLVPPAPAAPAAPPVVGTGGAPAGRPAGSGASAPPRLMAPFPVVRIAGSVFRRSARIRVLSVQLPWGARAEVRCSGRRCPVAVERRSAARRGRGASTTLRFRRFEGRSLAAGSTLTVRVTKAGTIGKYTRFRIRSGRAPSRVDRCVRPGSTRAVGCPGA